MAQSRDYRDPFTGLGVRPPAGAAGEFVLHAVFARLDPGLFPTYPAPLARLLEEVQADPGREASVAALARRVGMSRSRFAAWFRSHLGQAPAAWVRQVRVDHAARLLCLGDDSLEQIAAATGFPNRFHFTRVFTALAGLPPAAYRRRHSSPARAECDAGAGTFGWRGGNFPDRGRPP